MLIEIERRADYELYVNKCVESKFVNMSKPLKKLVVALAMQGFDDGVKYNLKDLKVHIHG